LSVLAVAALVGTFVMLVRSGGQGVGVGSATPLPTPIARTSASAISSTTMESTRPLPGIAPDDSALVGGLTNHLDFARKVATLLLTYDANTDFAERNADLLRAAAPSPYGDPTGLAKGAPIINTLGLLRVSGCSSSPGAIRGGSARRIR